MKILSQVCWLAIFSVGILAQSLPLGQTSVFVGSGNCATCHVQGSPNPAALLDSYGKDVSQSSYWRSTMMANAAKDPLWQAKVQAEISAHPHLQTLIEDKCTSCHAPIGNSQAAQDGQEDYSISEMLLDPLALDGVSCAVCHQIKAENLGEGSSFSGHFNIENDRLIYGPFSTPVVGPMQSMVNYTPVLSSHVERSELCATCHTLFTPYVDDAGEVAGEAPEQVPYLEWLNSDYPALGIECQTCHIPAIEENIVLSNRPQWLGTRNPLHTHEFVGGNIFMLKLLRDFGAELGVTASSAHFDSSISRTMKLLQNQTAALDLVAEWDSTGNTLNLGVGVQNLSGHKFPTAYPSRRAWVELKVANSFGEILFHSGAWDESGEIFGLDSGYESHHQLISAEDQVQIYQNIPMDLNGEKTYTLLRIAGYLKDNRIPPRGNSSEGVAADSTRVEGQAIEDDDFNDQGSGRDVIHYGVASLNSAEDYTITAILNYQSIAPRFVADLFSYDLPEVNRFQSFYDQMDNSPFVIDSVRFTLTSATLHGENVHTPNRSRLVTNYPNPFNPSTRIRVQVTESGLVMIRIYDLQGRIIKTLNSKALNAGSREFIWDATNNSDEEIEGGIYLLSVDMESAPFRGNVHIHQKMVYLK